MTQIRDKIIGAFHQSGVSLTEERLSEIEEWWSGWSESEVDERLSQDVSIRLEQRILSKSRRRSRTSLAST
jgi:hypothetical protein